MKWTTAVKWSFPVWVIAMSAIGAWVFLTVFVEEIGTPEAIKRFGLIVVVGLPLIAYLVKATADDIAAYRAVWGKADADEGSI